MSVAHLIIAMLVWFQAKHFVADYLMQPHWVLKGKGSMHHAGGYVHAGVHAIGSIPAYLVAGLGAVPILGLVAAEFVIHYAIDFAKAAWSRQSRAGPEKAAYWAMHGADQLMHQLTYAGLLLAVVRLADLAG